MEYSVKNDVATICIDDGKANAVNHNFIEQINQLLDKAETEAKAVILKGRDGMFCAGYDLKVIQSDPEKAKDMIHQGMVMLTRLYSHPQPIVSACEGHAIGLGAFLLMASDTRLGADDQYNVTLPETAIGMPFTPVLTALIHDRINPAHKTKAMLQSAPFTPKDAVHAGFLDGVIAKESLLDTSQAIAEQLTQLPIEYYQKNKLDLRSKALETMREYVNA